MFTQRGRSLLWRAAGLNSWCRFINYSPACKRSHDNQRLPAELLQDRSAEALLDSLRLTGCVLTAPLCVGAVIPNSRGGAASFFWGDFHSVNTWPTCVLHTLFKAAELIETIDTDSHWASSGTGSLPHMILTHTCLQAESTARCEPWNDTNPLNPPLLSHSLSSSLFTMWGWGCIGRRYGSDPIPDYMKPPIPAN